MLTPSVKNLNMFNSCRVRRLPGPVNSFFEHVQDGERGGLNVPPQKNKTAEAGIIEFLASVELVAVAVTA